jgi:hypothetical protein
MTIDAKDLWSLALGRPQIDPDDLAGDIVEQIRGGDLDFRTRLLIRDSMNGLRNYWGENRLSEWLAESELRKGIEYIWNDPELGEPGFSTLPSRIMEKIDPEVVRQYLRELGGHLHKPLTIHVAGSMALIMPEYISRGTDDIDIVDEVPADLRTQHQLLHDLSTRYGLKLGHVQSHYFPAGWRERIHSLGSFGSLRVYLLDVYDVFLSKLFSARTKDLDDLRLLLPQLDKTTLAQKFKDTCRDFLAAERLRQIAEKNWYILTGEPLPT